MNTHTEKWVWGEFGHEREAERDGELLFINMRTNVSMCPERNVNKIRVNRFLFLFVLISVNYREPTRKSNQPDLLPEVIKLLLLRHEGMD